jgi:hypothetical protein
MTDPVIDRAIQPTITVPVVALNEPGAHSRHRMFEWHMTEAMLGVAIVLVFIPNAIEQSRFWLLSFGFGHLGLLIFAGLFGGVRACALYWNGTWQYGYKVRAACALAGAAVWLNMAVALAASGGPLSITIPILLSLAHGEFRSCYRAVVDEGRT